jgi:DnaJ-class molecular chaperone
MTPNWADPIGISSRKQREWWEVLEVDSKAGPDEIRRAYLRKVQMYHPDRLAGLAPELVQLSESRTLELNLAFEQATRSAVNNRS